MPSSLKIHLIEHNQIRNSLISCYKGSLKTLLKSKPYFFDTAEEFEKCIFEVMSLILPDEDSKHFLVISAHGVPQTGGNLVKSIDLRKFSQYFKILSNRTKLIVFVSACWGGYASPIQAMASQVSKPTIIGPLVNIGHNHNLDLQNGILDVLLRNDEYEPELCKLVEKFNNKEKWRKRYRKNHFVGISTRKGKIIPPLGIGGLSERIEDKIYYRILKLEGPFQDLTGEYLHAILWDGEKSWRVTIDSLPRNNEGDQLILFPHDFIGKIIEAYPQISECPDPEDKSSVGMLQLSESSLTNIEMLKGNQPILYKKLFDGIP